LWVLRDLGGRGRGLVAARAVAAGALLLRSAPAALLAGAGRCGHCLAALSTSASSEACAGSCGERWCAGECALAGRAAHGAGECALLRAARSPPPLSSPPPEAVFAPVVLASRIAHGARLRAGGAAAGFVGALVPRRADVLAQRATVGASVPVLSQLPAMLALAARAGVLPPDVEEAEALALLAPQFHNGFAVLDESLAPVGHGIYPFGAMMNHSCRPTVHLSYEPADGRHTGLVVQAVHALVPLSPGDELTHAYVDVTAPRAQRAAALLERYGFACACGACTEEAQAEAAAAAAADALGAAAAGALAGARELLARARELATEPDDARTHAALAALQEARAWPPAVAAPDWRDARAVVALETALVGHALRTLRAHLGAAHCEVADAAARLAAAAELLGDRALVEAGLWQRLAWLRSRPALAAFADDDAITCGRAGSPAAAALAAAAPAHPLLLPHLHAIAAFYADWAAALGDAPIDGSVAARRAAAADLFATPLLAARTPADLRAHGAAASARAARIVERARGGSKAARGAAAAAGGAA